MEAAALQRRSVSAAGWREATIARIAPVTPRVARVSLDVAMPGHRAGQYLDLRLTAEDGHEARRSYSIASAPGAAPLQLLIERLDGGEVSPYFHDIAQAGDTIEVRGPLGGHFVWAPEQGGPLLLAGGGSGIAPLLSILAAREASARPVPMLLLYSARTFGDFVEPGRLLALERDDAAFDLRLATTREAKRRDGDLEHRFDSATVAEALARWGQAPRLAYVCGPNAFVEAIAQALVAAGVAPATIRTERYGSEGAVVPA